MPTLTPDKLLAAILGACLVLMALINVYMLFRFLPGSDSGERSVSAPAMPDHEVRADAPDASWLGTMAGLFDAMHPDGLCKLGENLDQSADILGSLAAVGTEQFPAWRETNQQRIGSLLADHRRQRQRLLQMREALAQTQATMASLRSEAWVDQKGSESANVRLAREIDELKTANKKLEEINAELQETYERTVQEKLFIEEAFVKLDQSLSEPAATNEARSSPGSVEAA